MYLIAKCHFFRSSAPLEQVLNWFTTSSMLTYIIMGFPTIWSHCIIFIANMYNLCYSNFIISQSIDRRPLDISLIFVPKMKKSCVFSYLTNDWDIMYRLEYGFENFHFAMIYTVQVDDLIDFLSLLSFWDCWAHQ